jgi:hypothetical protein
MHVKPMESLNLTNVTKINYLIDYDYNVTFDVWKYENNLKYYLIFKKIIILKMKVNYEFHVLILFFNHSHKTKI